MFTIFTAKIDWKDLLIMAISHYRKQRIMLLARLNLGLASEDKDEIDLYNHYQKNIYSEQNHTSNKKYLIDSRSKIWGN